MSIWGDPFYLMRIGSVIPSVSNIRNVGITDVGYNRVRFYSTDGSTLLHAEYVHDGDDCTYGEEEVWAISANSGISVPNITKNVQSNLDLYLARWKVDFYNYGGQTLIKSDWVIDGEDAEAPGDSLLIASVFENILAEGLCEDYISGSSDLGGLTITGAPSVDSDGALIMSGSEKYASMPSVADQTITVYGVIAQNGSTVQYQRYMSIYNSASTSREQLFCSYGATTTTLIWSSYNSDSYVYNFDSSKKHVFAISANMSTKKSRFYLDGAYLGEKSFTYLGYPYWTTSGIGYQYTNGNFYYGAVVSGQESDATIIANMQNIMAHYGLIS